MSKSAIYTANSSASTVPVGGTVPLGGTVRRFGCNARQSGDAINLSGGGYYSIDVSATIAPTAAGSPVLTLLRDGSAVPGARAAATASAAGDTVCLSFPAMVRLPQCGCTGASLSLVITGAESTVSSVSVRVVKL